MGLDDLEDLTRRLLRHSAGHVARTSGIAKKKVMLVAVGALILHSILRHHQLDAVHVSRRGLRDGMIAAFHQAGGNWWRYS